MVKIPPPPPQLVICDTGYIYSLAADDEYSQAAWKLWSGWQLSAPREVIAELQYRASNPTSASGVGLPSGLASKALGIVTSTSVGFVIKDPTDEQIRRTDALRRRFGEDDPPKHLGETAAAIHVVDNANVSGVPLLATDDKSCIPVLNSYIGEETSHRIRYVTTVGTLKKLVTRKIIDQEKADEMKSKLASAGRPVQS